MKKYGATVVADQFMFGKDTRMVVAMPDDVKMA